MKKFPFPIPPTSASLTGAVLASSVLILGLDSLEVQLWWLKLLRDIDRATGWTDFTSPHDWAYLFENRRYAAFHKVNSFLLLSALIFVITTIASWGWIIVRLNIAAHLREIREMIDYIKAHYADLKHHIPILDQQTQSALGRANGILSVTATLENWLKTLMHEPVSPPSQPRTSQDEGSSSHNLVRTQEQELEHAPKRKLEEKEKKHDIGLELGA